MLMNYRINAQIFQFTSLPITGGNFIINESKIYATWPPQLISWICFLKFLLSSEARQMVVLERELTQGATWRGVDALLFSPKSVPTKVSPQILSQIQGIVVQYICQQPLFFTLCLCHIFPWLSSIMIKFGETTGV